MQPIVDNDKKIYPWHIQNWEHLQRRMRKLPHALLFYAPAGTGVESFAEAFAKAMLCENRTPDGYACHSCQACRWFDLYAHPDYRLILPESLEMSRGIHNDEGGDSSDDEPEVGKKSREPSKKIGIDKIRSLVDFINISTHRGGLRIILLYPAEAMTTESANAILKMLEEPPEKTLFILVTNHLDALLPTIVSRCAKQGFSMPETSLALTWLKEQGIDDAESWLAEQGGAPLLALEEAQKGNRDEMTALLDELAAPDSSGFFNTVEKLQKVPMVSLITWQQRWLYDLLSLRLAGRLRYYPRYRTRLESMAKKADINVLLKVITKSKERMKTAEHPLVPRLVLEDMLLDYRKIFSPETRSIR